MNKENKENKENVTKGIKSLNFYVKDISFESPMAPNIFKSGFQPSIALQVEISHTNHSENIYEVTLQITSEAKGKDGKVGFIVEVEYAGLFEVVGFEQKDLAGILGSYCPSQIFPYIRQMIDSLLLSGGFPPLVLAPINFDQMASATNSSKDS